MNQKERLLDYLQSGKKLRRLDAWNELGILEAPARISEVKKGDFISIRCDFCGKPSTGELVYIYGPGI